jgi:hypothetical protein
VTDYIKLTHLRKPGYASPYRAQTACGLLASVYDVVENSPTCPECHERYLQQLVNEEAAVAEFEKGLS